MSAQRGTGHLPTDGISGRVLVDRLDPGYRLRVPTSGSVAVDVPPHWLRWLAPEA